MTVATVGQQPVAAARSRKDAARILGISVDSVDNMVKRGEIAALRYAGRTMIPVSELERLLTPAPPRALRYEEARAADHPTD